MFQPRPPFNVAIIIPTGIGASIGGFGGDGMTLLPLLASVCDTVITHPNVANAGCFQALPENTLYVEGYGLDRFFRGDWRLKPVRRNRIGVIWDSGIDADMETLHRNVMAAVRTVYGVDIMDIVPTRQPVELVMRTEASGRSAGAIGNPEVLLEAGASLIEQGATALAICCLMPEAVDSDEGQAYKTGSGVDPIAGLEAMISHLLVYSFKIPAAHAPVFPYKEALPVVDHLVDPRAASEFMVSTFMPCVLTGLARAPQFVMGDEALSNSLGVEDLSALLVPADALGGIPVLAALERGIPVLAVENNVTVMACSAEAFGVSGRVVRCGNYLEAIGHLVALKQGIQIPGHLRALA